MLVFIDKWHVMWQESQKSCQYSYLNAPNIVAKKPLKEPYFSFSSILLYLPYLIVFWFQKSSPPPKKKKEIICTNCLHFLVSDTHTDPFIYKNSQVGSLQENSDLQRCQVYKCNQSNACGTLHLDTFVAEWGSPNCRLPT